MNHPARLVALHQARVTLALGNRLVKRLEHPQQPRLRIGQRARRNRDPQRRQCPRHRAQRAVIGVALQHEPRPHAHPVGGVRKQPRRGRRHRLARRSAPTPRPGALAMDSAHMGRDCDLDNLRHRGAVRRIGPRAVRTASLRRLQRLLHHRQRRARCPAMSRRPRLLSPRPARTRCRDRRGASLRATPALAAPPERRVRKLTVQCAKPLHLALELSHPRAQRPVLHPQPVRGAVLITAERRQPRLQPLDLLAQPSRSRDVGSKRLDLLVPGPLPRAGPLVQRPKAARRATLPHQLPALCLELLLQRPASRAPRLLRRRVDRHRRDAASRNDSVFASRRHSSGIPQSGMSVQRCRRK